MSGLEQRKTHRIVVRGEGDILRLDQYIPYAVEELTRGESRKLIDLGGVHVNGRRVRKCSTSVRAGDRIEVNIDGLPILPYSITDDEILFEDRYLIVLNKKAGVDCQPTPSRYKGTLYAALAEYLKNPQRKDLQPTIGMVQRLDRDTSGVIVFSIHPKAHKEMSRMFREREVEKKYIALVSGEMTREYGEFRSQLARRRATNTMKSVQKGGREALTRFEVLERHRQYSRVDIEIPTGRSHQIRAHFAEAGHPLLGDIRYGGPDRLSGHAIPRQMLHARQLLLKHPVSGELLDFQAELPYDMKMCLEFFKDMK